MKLVNFKGIYPFTKKLSVGIDITPMRPMEFYNVPLKVKNIAESEPVIRVGDEVKQGTLIAKPSGNFGINIYSPVSGKVLNIFSKTTLNGDYAKHILIMNNNKNESVDLPEIESVSDVTLINRIRDAGLIDTISGMPTYLKYAYVGGRSYKTVIVLMDSTDPNNSINQTLAEYKTEEVVNGAKYFVNITSASAVTFVFTEANRKLAAKVKKHILDTKKNYDFKIKFIPNKYPLDNPYIFTNLVCGKKIKKGSSFLDAGITIESAEACYNFCRAVEFNKPVTSKIVTIDGNNVIRKGNYLIQNGVSIENLYDFIGVEDKETSSVLIEGNVMAGKAHYNKDISISLTTDSLILQKYDEYDESKEYPCISCGKCAAVCPMFLNPTSIDNAYLTERFDEISKLNAHACIECGCCSFICPARRYLTQRIATAKHYDRKNRGGSNG